MVLKIFLLFCLISRYSEAAYTISNKTFPSSFFFGVSSASYQIEGAWNEDGKGVSTWDTTYHTHPARDGSTGDVACDSYHKWKEDIEILKNLGVSHYRFSISWPRILPNGTGTVNQKGVAYYRNIIQALHEANIIPMVCMYHWDAPMAIANKGGLKSDQFPAWFTEYARVLFREYGSMVKYWFTYNEPINVCGDDGVNTYLKAHSMLKGHAAVYRMYEKEFKAKQGGKISMINAISYVAPQTSSKADTDAAEREMQFVLGWWANPLYHGDYPDVMKQRVAYRSKLEGFASSRLPEFTAAEKQMLKGTMDFFSINTYWSGLVKAVEKEPAIVKPTVRKNDFLAQDAGGKPGEPNGAWGIGPLMKWVSTHYNNPEILITENGFKSTDATYNDPGRIFYAQSYLSRIRDAITEGVKCFGYSYWSFMDDFEWGDGFSIKMGLYNVDFKSANRTRTIRKSGEWFKKLTKTRCLVDKCI